MGGFVHPKVIDDKIQELVNFGRVKIKKLSVTGLVTAAETTTGWYLPAHAIVVDTWIHITTLDAAGIAWGTGETLGASDGDADGYAVGVSTTNAVIVRPGVACTGANPDTIFASNTRGALLCSYNIGTNAADRGLYEEHPDTSSGGKLITYTPASATPLLVGAIYIAYIDLDSWPN